MAEPTFRRRLARAVSGLCLGILVTAGIALFLGAKAALETNRDRTLLAIARSELASALDGPGGRLHVHEEPPLTLDPASAGGYEKFAAIYDPDGAVAAQTRNLNEGSPLPIDRGLWDRASAGHVAFGFVSRDGRLLRALYYPLRDLRGSPHISVCALPEAPIRRALAEFATMILVTVSAAGGLTVFLAGRLARSLTRPLETIARQANAIGEQSLAERIPPVSADAELRAVSDALNGMLARLEAAFDAQQRFVQDASHELRTPLSNLKGTLEVTLRRPRTGEEYAETLRVALAETDRLSRLATDLLLLSRADTGRLLLHAAGIELAAVAAGAVCAAQPRAADRGLAVFLDATPAPIYGDAARLRQVFDNLLDNALRHAPAGTDIRVRVWTDADGAHASVYNGGPGIPPADRARVFDRFYRADPARARDSGGAGLGLAIVRAVVEAHQGRVRVESNASGTTFMADFPAGDRPPHAGGEPLVLSQN